MPSGNEMIDSGSVNRPPVEEIRVLIVESSVAMQSTLAQIFSEDPSIHVVGAVSNGADAMTQIEQLLPHVVTLDTKFSDMTGLDVLRRIRKRNPEIRVVLCSSATTRGAKATLDALMAGASHCVAKPEANADEYAHASFAENMLRKVCLHRTMHNPWGPHAGSIGRDSRNTYFGAENRRRTQVLAIGSATGGPVALAELLPLLPPDFALPVLIAQHMPEGGTGELAKRLSSLSRIEVVEAEDGMEVRPGVAILAPSDHHMRVVRRLSRVEIVLSKEYQEKEGCPSIDMLFRSVAEAYGRSAVAAVLAGAGRDGLQGAGVLKALGNPVVVQNQASSLAWEAPKAIVDAGLADAVLPLHEIVPAILRYVVTGQESVLPERAPHSPGSEMPAGSYGSLPQSV